MKLTTKQLAATERPWLNLVIRSFNHFLLEAADCERKSLNLAMHFTSKYPKYGSMMKGIIEIAQGNLVHFKKLYQLIEERNLVLPKEINKNLYINKLMMECRNGRVERFLDSLVASAIVELRAAERYDMLSPEMEKEELRALFGHFSSQKAAHATNYVQSAHDYFDRITVHTRMEHFLLAEKTVIDQTNHSPSLF